MTRIELQPGWGAMISTRDEDRESLAGVAILLDGELAGMTGADGRLRVVSENAPAKIEVDPAHWELLPGGLVETDGSYGDRDSGIVLILGAVQ